MKFNKIIFVRYLPLTQKISEDFYFEEISSSGIKVEYWDVSFILNGVSQIGEFKCELSRHFSSYSEIKKAIKREEICSTLFVLIMTYNGDVLRLYSLLSHYRCKLGVFGKNMFPTAPFSSRSVLSSSVITWRFIKKVVLNKLSILAKRYHLVQGHDIIFLAGRKGADGIGRVSPEEVAAADVVKINSDDYDRGLRMLGQKNEREIDYKYAVFLDEYLPLHQDLEIAGMQPISPELYYDSLNKTFSYLESKYGVKVVVAAHPKAIRYKEEDFFDGRKLFWGKTAELCRDCEFVLAHDSTSVNYAVMNHKPIISLISDDIEKTSPMIADSIKAFSSYLHTYLMNIDKPQIENIKLIVDEEAYKNFKYDFLTSPESENELTPVLLAQYLQR